MGNSEQNIATIALRDLFGLSLRIFKVKPWRTLLTILGIGISFATIFFLLSLGYGLQNILLRQISSEQALLTVDVTTQNEDILPIDERAFVAIKSLPNVKRVDPVIVARGQTEIGNVAIEALFQGVPQSAFEGLKTKLKAGRVLADEKENAILLSAGLYQVFYAGMGDVLGKEMRITFFVPEEPGSSTITIASEQKPYTVVGVMDDPENNFAFIAAPKVSHFNLPYGTLKVLVASEKHVREVKSQIIDMGYVVSAIADTVADANKIFKILQIILALFGIAALVVAVIGMVNTMTISLLERINEIGIMKVFGISEGDVEKLFILEAAMIGFLGGASGIAIGFVFSQFLNVVINILASTLGGKPVSLFVYPVWFIVTILSFSFVVGIITGFFPARRAARLDPLQALRYK
ncbi:MAG: ABC transporter permease [Candidatus Colwellbacteria bacterium]|nr:ABC transporter permease [Candidatus Colwellbacteria bacterium]